MLHEFSFKKIKKSNNRNIYIYIEYSNETKIETIKKKEKNRNLSI